MKIFRYLIVAVLFLLVAGTSGAQTREEKKEALKTYVGEQVNGRTFKLEASMAYPMSGRSIPLTTPYGLHAYSGGYPFSISGDIRSVPS